jgi:hypothetical protein
MPSAVATTGSASIRVVPGSRGKNGEREERLLPARAALCGARQEQALTTDLDDSRVNPRRGGDLSCQQTCRQERPPSQRDALPWPSALLEG